MSDYISKLPDDIRCHLLSLLTVRDSARARSLSRGWKDVPDCRGVLQFDSETVFGKDHWSCQRRQVKFVTAVDQFLKTWGAQTPREFHLEFGLTNEYTDNINTWIGSVTSKGVETIDLNLSLCTDGNGAHTYVLPCHLFHSNETSSLRHLRLQSCKAALCFGCKSWLSSLATLELRYVYLHESESESDMQHILSAAVNLTSLSLISCKGNLSHINIHHPCLKKLVIELEAFVDINCPNLETLDYTSYFCSVDTFSHFPFLRQLYLRLQCILLRCSCSFKVVDHFTKNAPMLQHFCLFVTSQISPSLASMGMHSLKRLLLQLWVPIGFDLFTITDVLHASPLLETLHLRISYRADMERSPERQYADRAHCGLKEIKITGYSEKWKETEFAAYLLKNAIALEQMIIVIKNFYECRAEPKFNLLQGIHPTAQLQIIQFPPYQNKRN